MSFIKIRSGNTMVKKIQYRCCDHLTTYRPKLLEEQRRHSISRLAIICSHWIKRLTARCPVRNGQIIVNSTKASGWSCLVEPMCRIDSSCRKSHQYWFLPFLTQDCSVIISAMRSIQTMRFVLWRWKACTGWLPNITCNLLLFSHLTNDLMTDRLV